MGLENATYIQGLTETYPVSNDPKKQGDDHLRLIKLVLKNNFPNADRPFYFPSTTTKTASFNVSAADANKSFLISTAAAAVTVTLPVLSAADAGWECSFLKTTTDVNPYFLTPPSGTIQSGEYAGLARARRCIPGRRTRLVWTGAMFIAERVETAPIGSTKDFHLAALPAGYEWPNGQTLASASTNYPEFYAANGNSGVTPDLCGFVLAAKDNLGGISAKGRLTTANFGSDPTGLNNVGGAETVTLTVAQMPAHKHTATSVDSGHIHQMATVYFANTGGAGGDGSFVGSSTRPTMSGTANITTTLADTGGGGAHPNIQPTKIVNKILVVE